MIKATLPEGYFKRPVRQIHRVNDVTTVTDYYVCTSCHTDVVKAHRGDVEFIGKTHNVSPCSICGTR